MGWEQIFQSTRGGLTRAAFVCAAFAAAGWASAGEPLTWAIYDLAPSYIVEGTPTPGDLGKGIGDTLLRMLIKSMPEYEHKVVLMTMPRIMAEMQAGRPICMVNALRSPERSKLAYSTPLLLTPAPQLVLKAGLLARHPAWKSGVSLAELTTDARLQGQYQTGRSFGEKIDAVVHAPGNVGLKANSGATAANSLRMIDIGRADYTIEYPVLVALRAQRGEVSDELTSVPLLDADPFVEGYAMCTRSDWGKAVLRRIDSELQAHATTREYQSALAHWLSKSELKLHQHDYERFYQTRANTRFCQADCP